MDINSLRMLHRFKHSCDLFTPRSVVRFSHNINILAIAMIDEGKLNLWNIRISNLICRIDTCSIDSLAFSPDDKTLAGACWDAPIKLWEVKTGNFLHNLGEADADFIDVEFSPDGKTVAGATSSYSDIDRHTVKLWNVETHDLLHSFKGGYVSDNSEGGCIIWTFFAMTFTPNGNLLISNDHTLNVWNTKIGNLAHSFDTDSHSIHSLSFVSGSNLLAVGFWDKIELWDILNFRPYLRMFHGQGGNWLMWNNQGEFWRGDDGGLLLKKDFSSLVAY